MDAIVTETSQHSAMTPATFAVLPSLAKPSSFVRSDLSIGDSSGFSAFFAALSSAQH